MIWQTLNKLSLKEVGGLIRLSFGNPLFLFPTVIATQRCIVLCTNYYGRDHHLHNKANAFRHSLWNLLIARKCYSWRKNLNKVLAWTERITEWHEDFGVNDPLARAMDLHNNEIGRNVFKATRKFSEEEHVTSLHHMLTHAVKIQSLDDLLQCKGKLVYISE